MKISVLVHNHNRASALAECLSSLERQTYRPLEIVVLDAQSTDGSSAVIEEACRKFQAAGIEAKSLRCELLGVAASRNLAAQNATGEVLCFIDNDATFVDEDALRRVARAFEDDDRLGATSFRVLLGDTDRLDPFAWIFRRPHEPWSQREFDTFIFAGTGFSVRATAFAEAGGFWSHLRYSREEEDLGLAFVDRGWRIRYSPGVVIRHYADARGRASLKERRTMELRNGLLVLWRRFPIPAAVALSGARILTMSLKSLLREGTLPIRFLSDAMGACREWRDNRLLREPIALRSMWRYARLHFS